ncbi:O-acetyl-ADP-ribose deacetylase [Gordonia defluvii]|jgi:O-acetyl-ADP-ribose deacetylase (regulator of RNase III)|uniref:O-acetyl-ADP-ribose deacetylase n=1 Tax=Gordonia defluvii TaxID=283718 RepID=A0ABP6L9X9_9ACTN|nr:macro domain-containing protein [Gordonia sp. UBA5067]
MPEPRVIHDDITRVDADAIVNAANTRMRGGGGVDGAIHRAGGMAILEDCVRRFPNGLVVGDAGWTTAGNLPARWVIHTVGPNYIAGQQDRSLLVACYRRSLEVADELGAQRIAFPLVSAGIFGWPLDDAIAVAADTIRGADTDVAEVLIVAFGSDVRDQVVRYLES